MNTRLIAITGGIGSGKSVVSTILRIMGFYVYDCDSEAKRLMNTSDVIKKDLIKCFGKDSVTKEGKINSSHISSIVFKDKTALHQINAIVHPRVKEDILAHRELCKQNVMFVETAILMQSNLIDIVDMVWLITAPDDIRINRVMARSNMRYDDVVNRIKAQQNQNLSSLQCPIYSIGNDGTTPLVPQINNLINNCI